MAKHSEDTKLALLSDHYKDTNQVIERNVKHRDRCFLVILVLLGVMSFQLFSPEQSGSILSQVAQKKLGVDASLSISLLGSLIWFGLAAAAIRYFQTVINLEKQYHYVHKLEDQLSPAYKGQAFTREGKSYLDDYPLFSEWLHIVYRLIFPLLLLSATTIKLYTEWRSNHYPAVPLIFDAMSFAILVIATLLYLLNIYFKK